MSIDTRAPGVVSADVDVQDWLAFRARREADLARPHDWLSVVGFVWLGDEPAAVPGVPGSWWVADGEAHVAARTADGLRLLGSSDAASGAADAASLGRATGVLDGEASVAVGEAGAVPFAAFRSGAGDAADDAASDDDDETEVRIEVLRRGGYYALRLRDPQAPARTSFDGVPTWDYDPAWRLTARLEPYAAPRSVVVGAAAPGLTQRANAVGEVVLERDGEEVRLVATGSPSSWSVAFTDATSGVTSSAWRAVAVLGDPADGEGEVDLNRTVNFPYAFTDFGTCPRPIEGNALPWAVEAGERSPSGRTGVPPTEGGPTALPGPQLLGGAVQED